MKNRFCKTIITGIFISLLISSVSAQNFQFQNLPKDKPQFGLRFLRPNLEGDVDLSTISGTYDLYFNIPLNSKINVVGSLPFTTLNTKDNESESGIGDIYIGLQTRSEFTAENRSIISLGVFLPTASEDKYSVSFLGMFTNFYELQKYLPNTLTLYGNFAFYSINSGGVMFGIEIGPNLWIPTKGEGRDTELLGHYGIVVGFQLTSLAIFAELVGMAIITEDVDDANDRFTHSLGLGAQWIGSAVRPGIFYKIYLKEDLNDFVDGVLGIKLDVVLQ